MEEQGEAAGPPSQQRRGNSCSPLAYQLFHPSRCVSCAPLCHSLAEEPGLLLQPRSAGRCTTAIGIGTEKTKRSQLCHWPPSTGEEGMTLEKASASAV